MPTPPDRMNPKLAAAIEAAIAGALSPTQPIALARDVLSAALPDLPKSSLSFPLKRLGKTNPRPHGALRGGTAGRSPGEAERRTNARRAGSTDPSSLSQTFHNPPESSLSLPKQEAGKTNPPLTPRQLAAARLLVRGRRVVEVAREIGVTRQTIAAWKRTDEFEMEVHRLHEMLAREIAQT